MKILPRRQKVLCSDCGESMRPRRFCNLSDCPRRAARGQTKQGAPQKTGLE